LIKNIGRTAPIVGTYNVKASTSFMAYRPKKTSRQATKSRIQPALNHSSKTYLQGIIGTSIAETPHHPISVNTGIATAISGRGLKANPDGC